MTFAACRSIGASGGRASGRAQGDDLRFAEGFVVEMGFGLEGFGLRLVVEGMVYRVEC